MEEYGMYPVKRHRGLAIASVILGSLSCFCCLGSGFGVIPAVIAIAFSIITMAAGGDTSSRKIARIGLITGLVGLLLNIAVIVIAAWAVNWSMLTPDRLATIQNIDPDNEVEVINWLQQFFKVDLSRWLLR